ncbi:hypothetical protein GGR52DRAFT_137179 [Hypoxylon sp. FL1284]|nr:hypothetical protein GGR52DRAFT_137179 [Hypoxylon sp. FL1284]
MIHWLKRLLRLFKPSPKIPDNVPTVAWLMQHRATWGYEPAPTGGHTPTASLYRMYEYWVLGFHMGLRTEVEFFFNQPTWAIAAIPDPKDPDPPRYAILSVLPYYMIRAFNRLIERGLPRGSPAILAGDEMERELRARPVVLEEEPAWAAKVPPLADTLTILDAEGEEPQPRSWSERFLSMNIISESPYIFFV